MLGFAGCDVLVWGSAQESCGVMWSVLVCGLPSGCLVGFGFWVCWFVLLGFFGRGSFFFCFGVVLFVLFVRGCLCCVVVGLCFGGGGVGFCGFVYGVWGGSL